MNQIITLSTQMTNNTTKIQQIIHMWPHMLTDTKIVTNSKCNHIQHVGILTPFPDFSVSQSQ